jgi:transposase-like protein
VTEDRPKGSPESDPASTEEDTRRLVRDIDESLRDANRLRERITTAACPSCGVSGHVDVTAFRWGGQRQLSWSCRACSHTWTMPERRSEDRS